MSNSIGRTVFGRPFVKKGSPCAIGGPLSCSCLSCLSVMSCLSVTLVYCGQMVGWITMKLGMELGIDPGYIVLDGYPALRPNFRPMSIVARQLNELRCHLIATEVGLGPGDIVLDGDPAPPPQKGAKPPILGPCLLWPNGWMDQDATCYGGRPQPRRLCV